jgi:hypothetical protein
MSDNQSENSQFWDNPNTLFPTYKPNPVPKIIIEDRRINDKGGVKADGIKKRPTLLLKSCNKAVDSIIDVLEYGAKKYSADNWKKVEHERYLDAAYRHMLAYTKGDVNDPETNMPHLAHAMCCLLFMLQMDLDKDAEEN